MWLPALICCLGEEPVDDVLYLAWELPYFSHDWHLIPS